MAQLPVAFRTNESKYRYSGSPRLINAYAEQQGPDAKAPLALLPAYGLTQFAAVADTPCRGTIYLPDIDRAYSVHSTSVFRVNGNGTSLRIGSIPGSDIVQISRNQATSPQISISCARGQFYIEDDVVKQVTDIDLPSGAISQDHVGGYTAYGFRDRRFFLSALNACQTVDGVDFATAEQSPDPLVRVKADRGDLFIFKQESVEPWRNTGNADFPFEPIGHIQKGLLAANAVASCDNTLMWPGHDSIVYRLVGNNQVQRISTHGIERKIEDDASPSSILGFSYSGEGHSFYNLTGADWSRTFDAATGFWHSRESYQLGYWRARFPFRAWGKTIVGDAISGNLYEIDKDAFTEAGEPLVWGMDSPILNAFPYGGVIDALHLDMETGVGRLPATAQGYQPKIMLSWSTDGGNTFKGNRELALGQRGDRVRVTTRRLGRFGPKGVQFRIRISDPVVRSLNAVDVQIRPIGNPGK